MPRSQGKSKRIGFDDESEGQRRREISAISDDISDMFKQCERCIQEVVRGVDPKDKNDAAMRKNVQVALATQLQEESLPFRRDQKKYLAKLKENESRSKYVPTRDSSYEDEVPFSSLPLSILLD
jgi:hypothetical protein